MPRAERLERHTESLVETEMKFSLNERNEFGKVFVQGEKTNITNIDNALSEAGGKPSLCNLDNYEIKGTGKAKPEFVLTFKNDLNTIIVIECKKNINKHISEDKNQPKKYAVDGALYYAKYLKEYYNVIAIAVSGTDKSKMKSNAYYWVKGQDDFMPLLKADGIILEPLNYLKLVKGEKVQKEYSLEDIQSTAVKMHNSLRINKMTEKLKPLFVAGILIALQDDNFSNDYMNMTSFNSLVNNCCSAIENVLCDGEIDSSKIEEIKNKFKEVNHVIKLKNTPLDEDNSLRWYINQLEMKVKPMMDYVGNTIDALGIFYHEFISYSSGDGNSLGIVLTPQHLTEFMAELINIDKNSYVVDICCGSGAFLVTAMGKMFKQARTDKEIEKIRLNHLYGIEQDSDIHTLALANMIIRKDGKSHIIHGDCFDKNTINKLKKLKDDRNKPIVLNKGLLNPPYSQDDHCELEFVKQELDLLSQNGELAVVCPMSCAIGTKFKEIRKELMNSHTLKAVFSMPDDIFYGNGSSTNVCVMVWEAHKKHNPNVETFFGYYKNDGFVKRKKLGRIDAFNKWDAIKERWLDLYRNQRIIDGLTAKACVTDKDEWLCEAYMKTDWSKLNDDCFKKTINSYVSFLVNNYFYPHLVVKNNKPLSLKKTKWKKYTLKSLFTIERGDRIVKNVDYFDTRDDDNLYPVITTTTSNNGVDGFYSQYNCEGNCLISAGEACGMFTTYQPNRCWTLDTVRVYTPIDFTMNKYVALFLASILNMEMYKFSYGRKAKASNMYPLEIKLPTKNGKPDWIFMEKYIKSLPYGDRV